VQHELVEDVELGLVQPVELVDADLEVFGAVARVALVLGDKAALLGPAELHQFARVDMACRGEPPAA
jgi:hypothetical protein